MKEFLMNRLVPVVFVCGVILGQAQAQPPLHPPYTPPPGPPIFSSWCRDRLMALNQAEYEARALYSRSRFDDALLALENGLHRAKDQVQQEYTGALTVNAILRGDAILEELKKTTAPGPKQSRTLAYFLFEYFGFIRQVANELDNTYYVPYRGGYGQCQDPIEFEYKFIEFAKRQVELVLNDLALSDRRTGAVYPIGLPESFLKALEMTASYLAYDLNNSLFATRYACDIDQLNYLSNRLHVYNTTKQGYIDDFDAVNASASQAAYLVGQIGACNGRPWHTLRRH